MSDFHPGKYLIALKGACRDDYLRSLKCKKTPALARRRLAKGHPWDFTRGWNPSVIHSSGVWSQNPYLTKSVISPSYSLRPRSTSTRPRPISPATPNASKPAKLCSPATATSPSPRSAPSKKPRCQTSKHRLGRDAAVCKLPADWDGPATATTVAHLFCISRACPSSPAITRARLTPST